MHVMIFFTVSMCLSRSPPLAPFSGANMEMILFLGFLSSGTDGSGRELWLPDCESLGPPPWLLILTGGAGGLSSHTPLSHIYTHVHLCSQKHMKGITQRREESIHATSVRCGWALRSGVREQSEQSKWTGSFTRSVTWRDVSRTVLQKSERVVHQYNLKGTSVGWRGAKWDGPGLCETTFKDNSMQFWSACTWLSNPLLHYILLSCYIWEGNTQLQSFENYIYKLLWDFIIFFTKKVLFQKSKIHLCGQTCSSFVNTSATSAAQEWEYCEFLEFFYTF